MAKPLEELKLDGTIVVADDDWDTVICIAGKMIEAANCIKAASTPAAIEACIEAYTSGIEDDCGVEVS